MSDINAWSHSFAVERLARNLGLVAEQLRTGEPRAIGGAFLLAAKGAPEAILPHAARYAGPNGDMPLDQQGSERLHAKVEELGRQGLRWGAALLCLVLIGIACYLPPPAEVLRLTPADLRAWVIVLATSLSAMLLGRAAVLALGWILTPASKPAAPDTIQGRPTAITAVWKGNPRD